MTTSEDRRDDADQDSDLATLDESQRGDRDAFARDDEQGRMGELLRARPARTDAPLGGIEARALEEAVRLDLTRDEVDLLMRLASGCDDSDEETSAIAARVERYLRRRLALPDVLEDCSRRLGCPARGCTECGNARPTCKKTWP